MNKTQLLSRLSCCLLLLVLFFSWPAQHAGWSEKKVAELLSTVGLLICIFPSGFKLNNERGQQVFDNAFFALGISLVFASNHLRFFK